MDVVYLVRPGGNEELRFSLRSLRNVPHDRVWMVGSPPSWVRNVTVLPPVLTGHKWLNLPRDLLAAARHPEVSEEFAYWNDDMYALRPAEDYPAWHRGPLSRWAATPSGSPYISGQRQTLALLRRWGYPEPLSYELHVPLVIDRGLFAEVIERALSEGQFAALAYRSAYANVAEVGGIEVPDVKVVNQRQKVPPDATWVSTGDGSFRGGDVGRQIRAALPGRSPYEEG